MDRKQTASEKTKPVCRQSCRVPMGGAQLKATLITSVIFGLFMLVAVSWVVFEAIEQRRGGAFELAVEFERPTMNLKQPQMNIAESSRPKTSTANIFSTVSEAIADGGEAADARGVFSEGAGYTMLSEMPAAEVRAEETLRTGFMSYRNEVRLGGSWANLDASGRDMERERTVMQRNPSRFYAVIFRITLDADGTLMEFSPEQIVDPRTETLVELELSSRFIESARMLMVDQDVELILEDGGHGEFYEVFFYDPQDPYTAIAQTVAAGN